MTFHKEGSTSLALCILLIFVINALIQFYHPQAYAFKWIVYILSFAFFVAVVLFFRNPSVEVVADEKVVLSPADGTVAAIEEVEETEYLKDKRIRVSVLLSPLNARVNRNPIAGTISYLKYHPGKFFAAQNAYPLTDNEHTTIVIEKSKNTMVLLRQVAGAFAKSMTWYVKDGDKVEQGQQFGFSKFASRVDIFLPVGCKVKVEPGEAVIAGETVLAEVKG